ncbi:S8 family peptidase [Phaeosphaeriaceae sp. PMI808]|nr:S8 family peptidase [Phaeosphaeriaceae sp. PMI808]
MAPNKDRAFPSELLASVAPEAYELLLLFAIQNRNAPASGIAGRLKYIGDELTSQSLYELPADAQQLSERALDDLLEICTWPGVSTSKTRCHCKKDPREVYETLCNRFQNDRAKIEQSITKFCKQRPTTITITHFQDRFAELAEKLTRNADDLHGSTVDANTYSHIEPLARDVYPDEVHQLLLDGIKRYSSCEQEKHTGSGSNPSKLHVTRLCLSSGYRAPKDQLALFNIITALSQMLYWQEMTIDVPIEKLDPKNQQNRQQGVACDQRNPTLIESGQICEWLEHPTFTKEGEFSVEHKIRLSYTVARAFWQFYSSDLMKARWTSEDIWFIRLDESVEGSDEIPLRAFVSFPFGSHFHEAPGEFYDEDKYLHSYPRILYLGIVLLEIGLGKSLGLERNSGRTLKAHINLARRKARKELEELKKADWDGFRWKDYYAKAISNCLDSANFKDTAKRQKVGPQGSKSDTKPYLNLPLEERRKALFRNVVTPLFWLATVGFENTEDIPRVPIRKKLRRQPTFADNDELQQFWREKSTQPSFCAGGTVNTEEFLTGLTDIAAHIYRCRRLAKVTRSIRVAILDSGCKKDLPFFQDPERFKYIKRWKDCTTNDSATETDTFGHGTFMVRLFMHVAPRIDVYLIRVAEGTDNLQNSQQSIAKAIEHAGLDPEWNVDIISMSFGYYDKPGMSHAIIEEAIEKVKKGRKDKVLFLASAGNTWSQRPNFPASHEDVIPIYAGDSKGVFLNSNPAHKGKKLATYGSDIPSSIVQEVSTHFPKADFGAGTSIATAIAAGIVALMLSYAIALPSLIKNEFEEVCAKLFTKKGMEHMLEAMSLTRHESEHFISPIWYWGEKQKDMELLTSICGAIEQMKKQLSE